MIDRTPLAPNGKADDLPTKALTGVPGFDALTDGGLPQGRATLLAGNAGSGKTVFALQTLVNAARDRGEPGIFVAFEEDSKRILANAQTFGWDLPSLQRKKLFFLDAQPDYDTVLSGQLDLGGMLAALGAKVDEMGARWIAFDAIDVVFALMGDSAHVRREIYRLNDWLIGRGLTALISAKANAGGDTGTPRILDFMQFMVDCLIILGHDLVEGTSQRNLRIVKFRGSAFEENAIPFLIGPSGIETAYATRVARPALPATHERVSSGIERLDVMLGGGFFRGGSILMTGGPGTAKTTLCGAFAEAACRRGEKTLFVSFDSRIDEMIRDLGSVGIGLDAWVKSGMLHMISARAISGSAETHLMRIRNAARKHGARCVVIDPLSALSKFGNRASSLGVAERLIDWAKNDGVTLMCTSLPDETIPNNDATPLQISTIADTWINLTYFARGGERNRALSILKSRGTDHSNQVREMILSGAGVALADVYTADGEVLMGTMRWSKERDERLSSERDAADNRLRRLGLEAEAAELEARLLMLKREIVLIGEERKTLVKEEHERIDHLVSNEVEMRNLRAANSPETSSEESPADD
jgi:circadian clock protein KaiC